MIVFVSKAKMSLIIRIYTSVYFKNSSSVASSLYKMKQYPVTDSLVSNNLFSTPIQQGYFSPGPHTDPEMFLSIFDTYTQDGRYFRTK